MARTRRAYAPEFRRQMVELVWSGRSPDDLAREFEPTAESIRACVARAGGKQDAREVKALAPAPSDPDELMRLRRENRQLRQERDILSNQRGLRSACGVETGSTYSLARR